ncbi:hypothetical protein [Schinkia azotoformans]|uniref:hypothetical protein n=1 Tax=Schinkia azotoformans TaxID=1454 RepID=UPI002DB6A8B6|nr:hypothetical protein [Schinkia azotoformans]MEC1744157.1 hypothetical protein [Schinkia azotoformans]
MYSIQQLQALDYLLKRITNESSFALYQKNLKLVVEINNSLWYGDFVQTKDSYATQLFIDDVGDIEYDSFSATGSNAAFILKKIWDSFYKMATKDNSRFWINPFQKITDLPLLFETLTKVLNSTEMDEDRSPFHPYLLNAKSLDGNIQLPFINLTGEQIKLKSIIEIEK